MAYGLPVVSTYHAGLPEAVIDQETGLLVPEGNSIEMADKIIYLAKNHDARIRLGKAGWKRASEYFSWEKEKQSLLELMNI